MTALSTAEAWALASKVALIDARHCDPQESASKREEALELMVRARELDPDPYLLINAQAYMERKVKPAAHYAPKSATCRVISNAEYAERIRKLSTKPSRRRGTKPASLPQLLSAAANSLKEP